jgi:hypothetical protein
MWGKEGWCRCSRMVGRGDGCGRWQQLRNIVEEDSSCNPTESHQGVPTSIKTNHTESNQEHILILIDQFTTQCRIVSTKQ